jgi:tetratricopeptide (TPR) repeat protein/transglutaminase-like putative cysteine protease
MLVWRFCLRGRLWAVLLVLLATSRPAGAAGLAWDDWAQAKRAELRGRVGRPEAIATLAALVQKQDYLAPGTVAEVLRDLLDGKLGGPVDPLVAAQAAYLLSLEDDRNGRFADADRRRKELGLLGNAWVLGPFDSQGRSGLGRAFPVEEEGSALDPRAGKEYAGKERRVAWQHAGAEAFVQGALFLDALLRPDTDVVAYCLVYVHSDRERWAALRVGSSGPIKAWLDGNEILVNDVVRPAWLDQDAAPVHLRQGGNLLVIKTVAVRGPWRLFLRLTDGQGGVLAGVTLGAEAAAQGAPAGGKTSKPPPVRELGALLRARAEHAPKTASTQAWLDQARLLWLVSPADSELRAVETAAKQAVPAAGAPLSAPAVQALRLLGHVAREEDDRRAALERALTAMASETVRAHVLADIGSLLLSQRRDDAAVAQWQKAVALDPGCVPAQLALAREERRASLAATAHARIASLPEAARRLPLVQDALADVLASLGRKRQAEEVQRAMLASQRTDIGLLRELAAGARARGDLAATARFYAEATRWRPDLISLVLDQAAVLEGGGDVAGARAVLGQASRRLPGDASLPEEIGRLEARAGRIDAALTSLRRALELRPQNPGLRRYLETLAAERKAKRETRSVEDLASSNAVDGEALARAVLFGPPAADDASAEVLLDHTVVRVHGNGLAERFVQRLVHARTERAARDGRETRVRFEPGRQEVEIRKARILRARSGGGLEISEATGRDEESLSEPWYGLYYDARAAVVTFENLRAGDVVEVQYTLTDVGYRNDLADYFGDFEVIADAWPTRRWDYTLIAPATRAFYFNQPRWPGIGPEREPRGAEIRYQFAATNVPRVESEPAMPGFAEVAPYLHVSTYRTWEDVGRWYWSLVRDQMQDDGTLKKAAAQAVSGLRTQAEKVKAIHRLVVESTRYVGLEFGIHGYKPYRVTQVFERRFGDCKDKATLLLALLGSVGIDSELVLLRTRRGGRIDETPASLAVFDHAIAYVPSLDLYVDGTAEFSGVDELPAEDQDTMALRVSARGVQLVRTPVLPAEKNLAQRKWRVDLQRDGSARISEELTVVGQAAHEWRSYYQTAGERRSRFAKAWNGRYAGTQLESVEMDLVGRNRPVVVRSRVKVPQLGDWRDGREAHLPTSSRDADLVSTYARLGERHWPLIIGYPWRHEESVSYRLPKGTRVLRLPGNRAVKNAFGEFTLAVSKTSDSIGITSVFVVNQSRIAPADYAAFRAFLRETDAALAERVVVDVGRAR